MQRLRLVLVALPLAVLGCGGVTPDKNPDPVEITGTVTLGGKPVDGATMNFQTTGQGAQALIPIKAGKYKGVVIPGKYTYYVTEGSHPAALKGVPAAWQAGSLERQVEIPGPMTLDVKLD